MTAQTPQVETSREGHLGVITLNRPEAINALNRGMIDTITDTLADWRDDPAIRVVLFEGRGARGFCSGGDVRAARAFVIAGQLAEADAYFAAEYAMNGLIAGYAKPIAAIGHGAVMGGGIGIAGHARYRFAFADARFAMPEAAIGFVSDIGVNAILAVAPEARALAFLMSGLAVTTADALALGLCDAAITPESVDEVRAGIVDAAEAGDPDTALVMVMAAHGVVPGEPVQTPLSDELAPVFSAHNAAEIVERLTRVSHEQPRFEGLAKALRARSPTSLEAILQSHRAARHLPDIAAVLRLDLAMASHMCRQPDFAEGVRAVLVDRDQQPRWHPSAAETVDMAEIAEVVSRATSAAGRIGPRRV